MKVAARSALCAGVLLLSVFAGCAQRAPMELACLDRFDIDRFEIGCWAWPAHRTEDGRGVYDEAYVKRLAADGFTALVGGLGDLHFQNYLMKVTGPVLNDPPFDLDLLETYDLRYMFGCYHTRAPRLLALHETWGRGRRVMGYQLNDNCDLHPYTYTATALLTKYAPKKIPWTSYNPNPIPQSRTGLPIISTQNYPFTWHGGKRPDAEIRREFCDIAENDRFIANAYGMAPWPVVVLCSAPSQYRFQVNAAAAYGAQAVWFFNYSPASSPAWSRVYVPTHRYLTRVAGPHLLGRRSIGVLHTGPTVPVGHDRPGPGKLIEAMDESLLAGLLVPEPEFDAGNLTVDCVYVVDKRTKQFANTKALVAACRKQKTWGSPIEESVPLITAMYEDDPAPREARITFSEKVRAVTVLLPDGSTQRHEISGDRTVTLPPLAGGAGILLRIEAEPLRTVHIPESAVALPLPVGWKFRFDDKEEAAKQKWHAPAFDDTKWGGMRVPAYCGWKFQQYNFGGRMLECGKKSGNGWYRMRWKVPPESLKKHLYLHFGAADEQAWVYADGKLVAEHTTESTGRSFGQLWKLPFHAEVTDTFNDGNEHTLAVRVLNAGGSGGLYEPVTLIAADEPLDADQLLRIAMAETRKNPWLRE